MPHHLEPVPSLSSDELDEDEGEWSRRSRRPDWWRWVAVVVVLALVVATPFAYALYLLLR